MVEKPPAPHQGLVATQNNPAAQVTDRASSIRIKGMRAIWVNPVVFLKIETSHGIAGWGDIKGMRAQSL